MKPELKTQAIRFFESSFETFYKHNMAIDADCRITWISEDYREFLGLKQNPVGLPVTDILPNSFMPGVVKSGQPVFLDILHVREKWVVVSAFPLKNDAGDITGAFGFVALDHMNRIQPLMEKYGSLQVKLKRTEQELRQTRKARYTLSQCIGSSEPMRAAKKRVRQAAGYDIAVLLQGETGTGKEMFAHALHNLSYRSDHAFVSVNVAAIPDTLMEAEFFGVAPGAYTGADRKGRPGKFELAEGGTIFLDEIGDMPLDIQAKLLRVLQEKEVERVGSNKLTTVDVRIIAATSKNLNAMVQQGTFRADLYYRLNSFPIELPTLSQRKEDIESLAEKFIEDLALSQNSFQKDLTPEALALLQQHQWPGNIRELRNVLEQAYVMSEDDVISRELLKTILPEGLEETESHVKALVQDAGSYTLADQMRRAEQGVIVEAIERANGRKSAAAKALGISRSSLYEKMTRLGISI